MTTVELKLAKPKYCIGDSVVIYTQNQYRLVEVKGGYHIKNVDSPKAQWEYFINEKAMTHPIYVKEDEIIYKV